MKKNLKSSLCREVQHLVQDVPTNAPDRLLLGTLVTNARASRNRVAERLGERLFAWNVVGPANVCRELRAQLFKHDELEGLNPYKATEHFCQILTAEAARSGKDADFKGNLFENSVRTINQIWHARQLADIHRLDYRIFVPRLVALAAQVSNGSIKPVDLPRVGRPLAERLGNVCDQRVIITT